VLLVLTMRRMVSSLAGLTIPLEAIGAALMDRSA
jgi:hypothetical protein